MPRFPPIASRIKRLAMSSWHVVIADFLNHMGRSCTSFWQEDAVLGVVTLWFRPKLESPVAAAASIHRRFLTDRQHAANLANQPRLP